MSEAYTENGKTYSVHPVTLGCKGCAFVDEGRAMKCRHRPCVAEGRADKTDVIFKAVGAEKFVPIVPARTGLKVYVIGSLRNPEIPSVAAKLRAAGLDVFDDWFAAGPEADDWWQKYEKNKGHTFQQALAGAAAQNVYNFDKRHLDAADAVVMVMPAGKSAHLELGYCAGTGKRTYILLDKEPERFDVMYAFATKVVASTEKLIKELT